jgi:hypothetical protein
LRWTEMLSHFGQRWDAREIFSISATLFRTKRPYLQPKRPALPVTLPFAEFSELAMINYPPNCLAIFVVATNILD